MPAAGLRRSDAAGEQNDAPAIAALLNPASIALVGASDRSRWSVLAYENLSQGGFRGAVHLINPRGALAHGRQTATSCRALGAQVDVGLVMTPAAAVTEAIADLAAAGAHSAIVLTSGFAETGTEGGQLQRRLRDVAAEHDIRLLGPNCLGLINFVDKTYAWTTPVKAPSKSTGVAIVSQSGATAYFMSTLAYQQDVGLSYVVSTGNEVDFDATSFIEFLLEDGSTRAIALFAETFRSPARFRRVAERALEVGKPLVVLKIGASEVTAKSALAHTGSLVGDDRVFDGLCEQFGIIRVRSMEELLATADVTGRTGVLRPGGLCVMTNSGGVAEVAADTAHLRHVSLPPVSATTAAALVATLPALATPHNPLDVTGAVTPEQCEGALRALGAQADYAAMLCPFYEIPATSGEMTERLAQSYHHLSRGMAAATVPGLLVSYTNATVTAHAREVVAQSGINYLACGLDRALAGLAAAFWWSQRRRDHGGRTVVVAGNPAITAERPRSEREALDYLSRQGVPVVPATLATSAVEAVDAARALGGPVVLKIASAEIAHKSDIGGVMLNVLGDAAVRTAYDQVMAAARVHVPQAAIEGVIVVPMRERGIELFVGFTRDAQWGPVLAVGFGGIWVEIMQDVALRLLPVDADEVKRMLNGLRGAKLLGGQRGVPAADLDAVAAAIVGIGEAIACLGPDLQELDVNPLWVRGDAVEALDALFVWRAKEKPCH